ncbi:MAG: hypothetical protein DI566_13570 [Microbacterium sp.]|nr:MAG: hypothetical protein DI566_13570 [Microbacterium sp.]
MGLVFDGREWISDSFALADVPARLSTLGAGAAGTRSDLDVERRFRQSRAPDAVVSTDPNIVGGLYDEDANVVLGFKPSGDTRTLGLDAYGDLTLRGSGLQSDYAWGLTDDEDKVGLGVEFDGGVYASLNEASFQRLEIRRLSRPEVSFANGNEVMTQANVVAGQSCDLKVVERGGVTRAYLQRTDIVSTTFVMQTKATARIGYYAGAGQSLGVGGGADDEGGVLWNALPPAPGNCLMFLGGSRGVEGGAIPAGSLADFAPLYEQIDNPAAPEKGETQGSGALSWAYRMAQLERAALPVSVFRCHGKGGQTIQQLVKGTNPYARGLTELQAAVAVAAKYGKQIRCNTIFWTQGENNRLDTTQADYLAALLQLHADYGADWGAILPSDNGTIHMVLDQLCSSIASYAGPVALAQLQAARETTTIHLSTPKYIFEMVDFVHLKAKEYALLGEYNMRCARVVESGGTWAPLWPIAFSRSGRIIRITFSQPGGKLEWNTRDVPAAPNYGFRYTDDGGVVDIASVAISAANVVTIALDGDPGANPAISYAYEGGVAITGRAKDWGNLISPSSDPSFQRPGRYLDHWCVCFKENL